MPLFNGHIQGEDFLPHPMTKKDACGANAVTRIKRTELNGGKYAPSVGDEVTLTIAVEAMKQ